MRALSPDLQAFARLLKRAYGLRDVRVAPGGREPALYLLAAPRTLERLLGKGGAARLLMLRLDARKGREDWRWRDIDVWDDLETAVRDAMAKLVPSVGDKGMDDWSVYPLPVPGGAVRRVSWSVAKARWLRPDRAKPFRLCDEPQLDVGRGAGGPLLLQAGWGWDEAPFFLAHSMKLQELRLAERCGGLLWPSFALSWKLPPGYGPVTFLASVDAAYDASRGKVTLHPTDAWSPDTRWLLRYERARNLERIADPRWWRGEVEQENGGWGQRGLQEDLLSSGIKPEDIGGQGWAPTAAGDLITSKQVLMRRMRKLLDIHEDWLWEYPEDVRDRVQDWDPVAHAPRGDFYPYLELKAAGVVRVGSLAACVYPARRRRLVEGALDRLGFKGWRVPYRWSGPLENLGKADGAALATKMTAVIRRFAADPCASGLPVPAAQQDWERRRYQPVARLIQGYDYASGLRGVAWQHGGGCGEGAQ